MKRKVYLDLEFTVIDQWFSGRLLQENVIKIQKFLDDVKPDELHIWSFAIWDAKHKEDFVNSGMKETISNLFGFRISSFLSVQEMKEHVFDYEHIHYNDSLEFMILNGKAWSFVKYANLSEEPAEFYLIDDAVPTLEVFNKTNNVKVTLLNIDRDF